MKRRKRLILVALFGPALLALAVGGIVSVLYMLPLRKPIEGQLLFVMLFAFVIAQAYAIWVAIREWDIPD